MATWNGEEQKEKGKKYDQEKRICVASKTATKIGSMPVMIKKRRDRYNEREHMLPLE